MRLRGFRLPDPRRLPTRLLRPVPLPRARRPGHRTIAASLAVLAVAGLAVGGIARVEINTSVESFLPAGDPAVADLQERAESFGGDPIVVLVESAEPGSLLGPDRLPRLLSLEGELAQLPNVAVVYGPATVLNQVAIQAQNLLAQITGRRDGLRAAAEQQAREAGAGPAAVARAGDEAVVEFDQRYGSLLVQGLPAGLPTLHNPSFVRSVIYDVEGAPKPQWRFVVPSDRAVTVLVRPRENLDQAGTERLVDAVRAAAGRPDLGSTRLTVTGVPSVTAALGEQVRREVPILGAIAATAVGLCFLAIPWLGGRGRRLVPLFVALGGTALTYAAFGWAGRGLSLGVVAFLPVLLGIGSYYALYVANRARVRGVLVVALASAASFASLAVSPVPFVREFGVALAIGVLVSAALALLVLRSRPGAAPLPAEREQCSAVVSAPPPRRVRMAVLAALIALSASGWAALPGLRVETDPQLLAAGLGALDDAGRAERVLGSSGEVAVVLDGDDVLRPEALEWSRRAQEALIVEYGDRLRPILSAPDLLQFLGRSPTAEQITAAMRLLPPYLSSAVVRNDRRASVSSFGVQLQNLDAQNRLLDDVRRALPPPPQGYRARVVGLPVVAARGYELVSDGRYAGNMLGIVAAGVVLVAGLGRRPDALRAALAAALATGWGLLVVWATGLSLSPLTVTLGSLTAATGCEFAVLLAQAGRRADRWLGRSVLVAALASAIGYAVLALSGLSMIRQFGLALAGSVILSYLAALVVLRLLPGRTDAAPGEPVGSPRTPLSGVRT
ncbi:RND transporter [Pseudonocardia bannensis]|uniref:RND transporter n=1 Tax=Pseudonocardia bannensis TaxID=630973 RepID=A0A848DFV0_9PSEU|nr:RND transporter [Pseudonocardia bannensis]NMH91411.1 RND transporter [Pseudonocardia bannensis]